MDNREKHLVRQIILLEFEIDTQEFDPFDVDHLQTLVRQLDNYIEQWEEHTGRDWNPN